MLVAIWKAAIALSRTCRIAVLNIKYKGSQVGAMSRPRFGNGSGQEDRIRCESGLKGRGWSLSRTERGKSQAEAQMLEAVSRVQRGGVIWADLPPPSQ